MSQGSELLVGVGVRLGVVKDIRILIARLIWDARADATYAE